MNQIEKKVRHHLVPMTILWWWSKDALISGETRKGDRNFKVVKLYWEKGETMVFYREVVKADNLIIKNYYSSKKASDELENKLSKLESGISLAFTYFNELIGTNDVDKSLFIKHARNLIYYVTIKHSLSPYVKSADFNFNNEHSDDYNDHFNEIFERLEALKTKIDYKAMTIVVNATGVPLINNVACSIYTEKGVQGDIIIPLSPWRYLLIEKQSEDAAMASNADKFSLKWKVLKNNSAGIRTIEKINLYSLLYSVQSFAIAPMVLSLDQFYHFENMLLKYFKSPKNKMNAEKLKNNPTKIDPKINFAFNNLALELAEDMIKLLESMNN